MTHILPIGFYDSIAQNDEDNIQSIFLLGKNTSLTRDSLPQVVKPTGGEYPYASGNTTLEVLSTSAVDGSGNVTIGIIGLNDNYDQISTFSVLNGTTPVTIGTQFFRVNRVVLLKADTPIQTNTGTITVREQGGGATWATIPPMEGSSRDGSFTCPKDWQLVISGYSLHCHRNKDANNATQQKPPSFLFSVNLFSGFPNPGQEAIIGPHWRKNTFISMGTGREDINLDQPVYLQPKSQIEVRFEELSADQNRIYTVAFYVQGRLRKVE